jgi:branched-chain amino acid transport system permease protein
MVIALRIVRSPVGAVLRAIRDNPLRAARSAQHPRLQADRLRRCRRLCGFRRRAARRDARLHAARRLHVRHVRQLVMQTAIGGAGTLFGPLVGATVWLYLSDFLQTTAYRRDLEARARRDLRAAGLLPAPRH